MAEDRSGPGASNEDAGSGAAGTSEDRHPIPGRDPLPTRVQGLPPLPEDSRAAIAAGLPAIPVELPDDRLATLDGHLRLLVAWNSAINLTAIRDPLAMATGHVLDSLTAVPLLRRAGIDEFVDLGSGAGFPGIPLAVALPARRALLVESVAKKARFLRTVVDETGLSERVAVEASRVEALGADPRQRSRWQAVVARAVADLGELAELSLPLLRPGGLLVAWKREPLDAELRDAERALRGLGGEITELFPVTVPGLEDHVLVVVRKIRETPSSFPRDPAIRRRRPL